MDTVGANLSKAQIAKKYHNTTAHSLWWKGFISWYRRQNKWLVIRKNKINLVHQSSYYTDGTTKFKVKPRWSIDNGN